MISPGPHRSFDKPADTAIRSEKRHRNQGCHEGIISLNHSLYKLIYNGCVNHHFLQVGGGTVLTGEGKNIVRLYRLIESEHRRFLESLEGMASPPAGLHPHLKGGVMKVSARNVLCGTVERVKEGPVSAEVRMQLPGLPTRRRPRSPSDDGGRDD